jgi:hypothetical protein
MENSIFRENDEHWQDNILGLRLSKRVERAIHERARREEYQWLLEHPRAKRMMHETVLLAVLDPKTHKILEAAINKPNDLILDNFGNWFAALIRNPVTGAPQITLKDVANANKIICPFGASASSAYPFNYSFVATGAYLQVGKGQTTPQRFNYNIETAFGTSPENAVFGAGAGSYSTGVISFSSSVTAGGSDTAYETGFFGRWCDYGQNLCTIMLFHDLLASGVPFVPGKSLVTSYAMLI